ncbi:desmoplakin-like, partial [Heptranchias perlo]|uniref:desmoplakin-like n=1 Tax=Heptranchias perlo TaxID=212740 RepID=UPI00355948FE
RHETHVYFFSLSLSSSSQREPGAAQNHPVKQPAGEPRRVQADSQRQLQLQGLLDNLERENRDLQMLCGVLKQEKSELAWTVKELQGQLQSSSQERLSLKSQLDHLGEDETGGGSRRKLSGRALDLAVIERAQKADQEAALAKAQLIAVLEKYDRVEKDNQSMADEIHHFREEIGRLRQRPSR